MVNAVFAIFIFSIVIFIDRANAIDGDDPELFNKAEIAAFQELSPKTTYCPKKGTQMECEHVARASITAEGMEKVMEASFNHLNSRGEIEKALVHPYGDISIPLPMGASIEDLEVKEAKFSMEKPKCHRDTGCEVNIKLDKFEASGRVISGLGESSKVTVSAEGVTFSARARLPDSTQGEPAKSISEFRIESKTYEETGERTPSINVPAGSISMELDVGDIEDVDEEIARIEKERLSPKEQAALNRVKAISNPEDKVRAFRRYLMTEAPEFRQGVAIALDLANRKLQDDGSVTMENVRTVLNEKLSQIEDAINDNISALDELINTRAMLPKPHLGTAIRIDRKKKEIEGHIDKVKSHVKRWNRSKGSREAEARANAFEEKVQEKLADYEKALAESVEAIKGRDPYKLAQAKAKRVAAEKALVNMDLSEYSRGKQNKLRKLLKKIKKGADEKKALQDQFKRELADLDNNIQLAIAVQKAQMLEYFSDFDVYNTRDDNSCVGKPTISRDKDPCETPDHHDLRTEVSIKAINNYMKELAESGLLDFCDTGFEELTVKRQGKKVEERYCRGQWMEFNGDHPKLLWEEGEDGQPKLVLSYSHIVGQRKKLLSLFPVSASGEVKTSFEVNPVPCKDEEGNPDPNGNLCLDFADPEVKSQKSTVDWIPFIGKPIFENVAGGAIKDAIKGAGSAGLGTRGLPVGEDQFGFDVKLEGTCKIKPEDGDEGSIVLYSHFEPKK